MKIKYPVYRPTLSGNEKKYVLECLDSTWISSKGRFVNQFEAEFSKFFGIKYSASVSNGTVALHVALLALGIRPGDEVIVPSFTYIASVNSIHYTGATPVFVDSEPESLQMDPEDVEQKITGRTRAVMAVHLYGHPCNMDKLRTLCEKHNLFLVEDCAESFGSKFNKTFTGRFGDIATFSFFGNKTITTGEGGMVVTDNKELYEKVFHLKGQGLAAGKEYYHDIVGYNYRMTNICAALGCAQLERANEIIEKKRQIAEWYNELLQDLPVKFHTGVGPVFHTYWMITIIVNEPDHRDRLRHYLGENGIETRPTFYPAHNMPMYFKKGLSLPIAENLGDSGINLPSYPDLYYDDINFICEQIRVYFSRV